MTVKTQTEIVYHSFSKYWYETCMRNI